LKFQGDSQLTFFHRIKASMWFKKNPDQQDNNQ